MARWGTERFAPSLDSAIQPNPVPSIARVNYFGLFEQRNQQPGRRFAIGFGRPASSAPPTTPWRRSVRARGAPFKSAFGTSTIKLKAIAIEPWGERRDLAEADHDAHDVPLRVSALVRTEVARFFISSAPARLGSGQRGEQSEQRCRRGGSGQGPPHSVTPEDQSDRLIAI